MSRALKPHPVEEVWSENRLVKATIYFDRNQKDFFGEVAGASAPVRDATVDGCRSKLRIALGTARPLAWRGVIVVDVQSSYDASERSWGSPRYQRGEGASVHFKFRRCEISLEPMIAKGEKASFIERSHTIDFETTEPDDDDRKRRERNQPEHRHFERYRGPTPDDDGETDDEKGWSVEVPYDQATWDGLVAMKASIDGARAKLKALLRRRDFQGRVRRIAAHGAPALLPPTGGK